jgi:GxxExxY protein
MPNITSTGERDEQTSLILAVAIEVHKELGRGFFERVYRRPLELELEVRGIPYQTEVSFPIVYKGRATGVRYRVDLICFDSVIVEIKALKEITSYETAQLINYMRASGMKRALLLNFGSPVLGIERRVC